MENANDVALLHEIYQNARIGMDAADMIMPKTKDLGLVGDLSAQRAQYLDIAKKAAQQLLNRNVFPADHNMLGRSALWTSVQFSTLLDTTPKHLAQLMINGSRKGVEELNVLLARHMQTEQKTVDLANEFITLEQNNMQKLNGYLS